jgi:hypothetical protein
MMDGRELIIWIERVVYDVHVASSARKALTERWWIKGGVDVEGEVEVGEEVGDVRCSWCAGSTNRSARACSATEHDGVQNECAVQTSVHECEMECTNVHGK